MLSADEYGYLYGKLKVEKIPKHIMEKIHIGEDFTEEEEILIKKLIHDDMDCKKERNETI